MPSLIPHQLPDHSPVQAISQPSLRHTDRSRAAGPLVKFLATLQKYEGKRKKRRRKGKQDDEQGNRVLVWLLVSDRIHPGCFSREEKRVVNRAFISQRNFKCGQSSSVQKLCVVFRSHNRGICMKPWEYKASGDGWQGLEPVIRTGSHHLSRHNYILQSASTYAMVLTSGFHLCQCWLRWPGVQELDIWTVSGIKVFSHSNV